MLRKRTFLKHAYRPRARGSRLIPGMLVVGVQSESSAIRKLSRSARKAMSVWASSISQLNGVVLTYVDLEGSLV